jgi:hypothetical protein
MSNEYVSATVLKATLSLTGETYADADLTVACAAASRAIDRASNRRFYADADATQVRYYTPHSPWLVAIDDAIAVTSVKVDTSADGTWATTLTNNTDFTLEPVNAAADGLPWTRICVVQRSGLILYPDPRYVKVTGKFGWAAVPDEIVQATTLLAARLVKRAREAPLGVTGLGLDGVAVRVPRLDPDVEAMISPYQRLGV